MRSPRALLSSILVLTLSTAAAQTPAPHELQPPSAFQGIGDRAQRSRAIFNELGKVLTHPRCMHVIPRKAGVPMKPPASEKEKPDVLADHALKMAAALKG